MLRETDKQTEKERKKNTNTRPPVRLACVASSVPELQESTSLTGLSVMDIVKSIVLKTVRQ